MDYNAAITIKTDNSIDYCQPNPQSPKPPMDHNDIFAWDDLAKRLKQQALQLGFSQVGITDIDVSAEIPAFTQWLQQHYHGEMDYMARHQALRGAPEQLHPGTLKVVSVSLNYLPEKAQFATHLNDLNLAYISRYANGRDYHKLMRNRLKQLGDWLKQQLPESVDLNFRPFVDSAPILERPLARNAGLGWVGKHSLLLNEQQGSWFFLGELLINLPLPSDPSNQQDCGRCTACIKLCPTQAIVAPYVVDSRRCISYLTIEADGPIPEALRPAIGNRIYGCDDCQLGCPVNQAAPLTLEADFQKRQIWQQPELLTLWQWDEATFLKHTEGSAIRRIGYRRWQRNLAVALGNGVATSEHIQQLQQGLGRVDDMVDEHIHWAIARLQQQLPQAAQSPSPLPLSRQQQRLVRIVEKGLKRDAH